MKDINKYISIVIEDHNDHYDVYATCKINIAICGMKKIEISNVVETAAQKINEIVYGKTIKDIGTEGIIIDVINQRIRKTN